MGEKDKQAGMFFDRNHLNSHILGLWTSKRGWFGIPLIVFYTTMTIVAATMTGAVAGGVVGGVLSAVVGGIINAVFLLGYSERINREKACKAPEDGVDTKPGE
uniref:Uncharacterized protein n=1 Tax=Candidatus Kentrum sp. FM TaxID=2126340 RepID=A0A450ST92_9GAMM|nr:MAG: hypothetical protein BECKFM1743C_GA0114222_101951 [Candidatus Kentron sp. FM]